MTEAVAAAAAAAGEATAGELPKDMEVLAKRPKPPTVKEELLLYPDTLAVDDGGGAEGRTMAGVGREEKVRKPYGGSSRLPVGAWRFSLEDDNEEEGGLCLPDGWEDAPLNGGGGRLPFAGAALGFSWLMADGVLGGDSVSLMFWGRRRREW